MQGFLSLTLGLTAMVSLGAAVYFGSLFLLWYLADRPDGFEAKAANLLSIYSNKIMLQLGY